MNIRPEFKVHMVSTLGRGKCESVAEGFSILLDGLEGLGITGRDLALVKTKLEEAAFFAKRGVASLPENQE